MPSLTHVCMWSEHGWKKITANEAARLYPGGMVSAACGLFMCELCGQYVILTEGEKNVRHFRHKISEKSKDCPERTFGSSVCMTYNAKEYELPIRICNITGNQFDLELGLLYVPQFILVSAVSLEEQIRYIGSLKQILGMPGYDIHIFSDSITVRKWGIQKKIVVYPEMWVEPFEKDVIYVSS